MENLKLTSIRLSKNALAKANEIARAFGYYQSSHIIRIALWVGLKVIRPGVLPKLIYMMWEEEDLGVEHSLEDVMRAAGYEL